MTATYAWLEQGRVHILAKNGLCVCFMPASALTDVSDQYPSAENLKPCVKCRQLSEWQNSPKKRHAIKLKDRRKQQQSWKTKRARILPAKAWNELRYEALRKSDGKCQLCGAGKSEGAVLHVDHIKPVSKFPKLARDPKNLQVLCKPCNLGKSNRDQTDWRREPEPSFERRILGDDSAP